MLTGATGPQHVKSSILRILEVLPLLPRAVVGTASFAGLREGELRGLEWSDYTGEALGVNRSIWKGIVNKPKTRASRQPVPVITKLATILDEYRASMHNLRTGVMFHNRNGECLDTDKLAHSRDSSGSRGHWAALVWVARFPSRDRIQSLRIGCQR